MTEGYKKKYRWQHTWGDERGRDGKRHQDYEGFDNERSIGRIRIELNNLARGSWHWAGKYPRPMRGTPIMPNAGYKPTAAEAAATVEDYWDRMKALVEMRRPVAE